MRDKSGIYSKFTIFLGAIPACTPRVRVEAIDATRDAATLPKGKAHTRRSRGGKLVFSFGRALKLSDGDVTVVKSLSVRPPYNDDND